MYLMIMSAAHASLFYRKAQDRAASLARARLEILKGQLQPHFLFNTLNTIAELVHTDPEKADSMIIALSDMLRVTLNADSASLVPLAREMEFTQHYLHIMQTRFGNRLQYVTDIPAAAQAALVPPFLLQPLVENAVLHGIQPKAGAGLITIRARVDGGELFLTVADDGVGLLKSKPRREGLGVENTRARLQELFAGATSVVLKSDGGVCASITMPYQPK
jgi:LytS/YehU family sensor histidine kinase